MPGGGQPPAPGSPPLRKDRLYFSHEKRFLATSPVSAVRLSAFAAGRDSESPEAASSEVSVRSRWEHRVVRRSGGACLSNAALQPEAAVHIIAAKDELVALVVQIDALEGITELVVTVVDVAQAVNHWWRFL